MLPLQIGQYRLHIMRIERARQQDADVCFDIQRAAAVAAFAHIFPPIAYPFPDDAIRAGWVSALADPDVDAFIAQLGEEAVGTVSIGYGFLRTLFVLPRAWRHGVGSLLHDFALDRLQEAGVTQARLWTLAENDQARSFYETRGWTPTGATRVVPFPPNPIDVEYARPTDLTETHASAGGQS